MVRCIVLIVENIENKLLKPQSIVWYFNRITHLSIFSYDLKKHDDKF